MTIQKDT